MRKKRWGASPLEQDRANKRTYATSCIRGQRKRPLKTVTTTLNKPADRVKKLTRNKKTHLQGKDPEKRGRKKARPTRRRWEKKDRTRRRLGEKRGGGAVGEGAGRNAPCPWEIAVGEVTQSPQKPICSQKGTNADFPSEKREKTGPKQFPKETERAKENQWPPRSKGGGRRG